MPTSLNTAVIIVDPYNDFLHENGKLNGLLKESLEEKETIAHLQEVVKAARKHGIPIFYCLHQQMRPGFLMGWNHATEMQKSQKSNVVFDAGSWGAEIYDGLQPIVDSGAGDVVVSKHWSSS
jgi:nicotinamidase-related amidase